MSDFLATYDLRNTNPSPYTEFLKQAAKLGYYPWIAGSDKYYRLPNTTLEGTFTSRDAAVAALKAARAATEKELGITVTMEKWVVTSSDNATFQSDVTQPKK